MVDAALTVAARHGGKVVERSRSTHMQGQINYVKLPAKQ